MSPRRSDSAVEQLAEVVRQISELDRSDPSVGALIAKATEAAAAVETLVDSLQERRELFERLSRIQRSISHRAPLQEVLDAVTSGAVEMLGDEIAGIRLIDPEDPEYLVLASVQGVTPSQLEELRRGPVGEGAGGRAIAENRLVIIESYPTDPTAIPVLVADQLQAAMAAPVRESGKVVGSLVVATYQRDRHYSKLEKEALLALAEHASLALTDARTLEAMREAQIAKDMFLAMVSHELKTPLTVIVGTLRTFQKHYDTLTATLRQDMLKSAFDRAQELERLIDRLLQGSRAELAGVRQHLFLPDLVADGTRGFGRDRVLVEKVPEVFVHTDSIAVQKVIGVLLENAISHSPPNSEITVTTRAENGEVSISVRNVGSLPEGLDHSTLFLPFQRGPNPRSTGVGLGLYIASRLALTVGGRITAESTAGTVAFNFEFPMGTPRPEERGPSRTEQQEDVGNI